MTELLSPAGSMDALRAAVQNGADAVYLGGEAFNARMGAHNFTFDELQQAVSYCHVRGVKVHLTLNTLVSDREMIRLAEQIRTASMLGVDAFIVQDLGVCMLCRELAPHIPLHASTQMSIHSLEGVQQAHDLGCSRVVLARELPKGDLARICAKSPAEIEVFVHGALCMCYSGQCYLSSLIGRRSGNRGQCAQPCRLPYGYGRFEPERYPLSLKDNCLIEHLSELREMGVASLKIEGRMKRPEYVAIVTRLYRAALDGKNVTADDIRQLEDIFSRQGFTQGYYKGEIGTDMFGTRQETGEHRELLAAARASYENGENPVVGVTLYALCRKGEPAQLAAQDDDGHICKTKGPVPEEGILRTLSEQELSERLSKTGGTPYFVKNCKIVLDEGLMLTASQINAMRRDVLSQLTALRGRVKEAKLAPYQASEHFDGVSGEMELTVSVRTASQITPKLLSMKPSVLYVPLAELVEHPEIAETVGLETQLAAILPRVVWSSENPGLAAMLKTVYDLGVRQLLCGNLAQLRIAKAAGFAIRGDFGLNIYNSRAMNYLRRFGLDSQLLSFEMTLPQIRDISKAVPCEVMVYGRLPLMLTENCIIRGRTGNCACTAAAPTKLIDRMGEEFPVLKDPGTCRSVVYNGKKLYLLDKLDSFRGMGLWAARICFTTENQSEVDSVLRQYSSGGSFDAGSYTRGLYTRGVE